MVAKEINKPLYRNINGEKVRINPMTRSICVTMLDGRTVEEAIADCYASSGGGSNSGTSGGTNIDLSKYATKAELNQKADLNHNHDSLYAKKVHNHDESYATKTHVHDEYATEDYVMDKIAEAQLNNEGSVDLSGYATKDELRQKADLNHVHDEYATESFVTSKIEEAQLNSGESIDLGNYATKDELGSKADLNHNHDSLYATKTHTHSEYATESFVTNKIAEAQLSGEGTIDLTGYATKDELNNKVDKVVGKSLVLDTEIERLSQVRNYDDTEVKTTIEGKANKVHTHTVSDIEDLSIPTKVSELENDVNFLTEHQDISGLATKTELGTKVDKVTGKQLSTEDYTTVDKEKLANIEAEANKYVHPKTHSATIITQDETHRFVTDTEKANWDNKSDFSGDYNDLTNRPTIPTKTSELVNDSGYLTSVPSEYVTQTELDEKGYLTEHQDISNLATKSELHNHNNLALLETITSQKIAGWDNKSNFSGDYNDLTNKPTVTNGQDGATFTPSVDGNGNLSWTNNKGLTNPTTVNIKGVKGDKGDKGLDGLNGQDGQNGQDGRDGQTPNITIGTVTTLEPNEKASASITGTTPNLVLNLGIPKGVSETLKQSLVTNSVVGGTLTLTTDKYQYATLSSGNTIRLPSVADITEIHLFFATTSDLTLIFPSARWQSQPTIVANKTYEVIFTYVKNEWLAGVVEYE